MTNNQQVWDTILSLMKSGQTQQAQEYMQSQIDLIERDSWDAYHNLELATTVLKNPELVQRAAQMYERLVPETISKDEFCRRFEISCRRQQIPASATFHLQEQRLSGPQLCELLWLGQTEYIRWIDFQYLDAAADHIQVTCGPIVETFRDVHHHSEGHGYGCAPFR